MNENNQEQTNNENTLDKVHHHLNKSVVSRIIVVTVSLLLAMALGYVLYSQLLTQSAMVDPAPEATEEAAVVEEEVEGFDMSTFDENDADSRRSLLEYISTQSDQEEGSGEDAITVEERQDILNAISEQEEDESDGEEISAEERMNILDAISKNDEEVESDAGLGEEPLEVN